MIDLLNFCGGPFGLGFSIFIIILGLINLAFALSIKSSAINISDKLKGDLFQDYNNGKNKTDLILEAYKESEKGYRKVNFSFRLFIAFSETFPLLGILGTLIALIQYRGQISNLKANFSAAILTTMLGIVFAVIFKLFEGYILGSIDFIKARMIFHQDLHSKIQFQNKESIKANSEEELKTQ